MELNRNWLYVECNYIEKGDSFYCFGLQNRNKFGLKFGKGVWFMGDQGLGLDLGFKIHF